MASKNDIKLQTLKYMNGVKYLTKEILLGVKELVCMQLGCEHSEENYKTVEEAVNCYFDEQIQ